MFLKKVWLLITAFAFLTFVGQASAGPNANATLSLDLIPDGGAENQIDDGVTSGNISGQGTKIAVEVFAKGVTIPLFAVNIEFEFDASILKLDKAENPMFQFIVPGAMSASLAGFELVRLPESGFLARVEFSTVSDVTGQEFTLGIKQVTLSESVSLSDEITTTSMILFNPVCPGDFDDNGTVNIADFLAFVAVFGTQFGDANYNALMDMDGSGQIGIADFLSFVAVFGTICN